MGVELRGSREDNVWTKAEGKGHQHGFELKEHLESKNAITLPDILELSAAKYGEQFCIGTRKLVERKKFDEGGKSLEKLVLGEYQWKSYREVQDMVTKVAAGVQALGFKKGDRILIFAETRAEWFVSAIGCLRFGLTVVTLYTNLPDSGVVHGIEETEVDTVLTSYDLYQRVLSILPQCSRVKRLILFEDQLEGVGNVTAPTTVQVIPFENLLTLGKPEDLDDESKPSGQDSAIIMYTSGSTGQPKGVEITHNNIFYAFIAYTIQADLCQEDRYIAYLPLAHIMELITEVALVSLGVTLAYSSPLTLTSNSPKIAKGTEGDARVARPTALTAVPLILDRIIKAVTVNVEKQGRLKSTLFKGALRYKQNNGLSFTGRLLDLIIFNKVKAELGGSVKMMVVGGAPLSSQTHSMIRAMFGCTLQVGYGCTESTACITSMDSDDTRTGHVGPPNPYVKVKLVNWEEGDYRISDKPRPRGEIVVGSPCVAQGYFKLPSETEESFYAEDGTQWFRTGDIGEFDETGVLYVIDRKKDLVKLKHGEYVSLGNVESKLKTSSLVENVCVIAKSSEDHTVAIIYPSMIALRKLAKDNFKNLDEEISTDKLCVNSQIVESFLCKLKSHGKQAGLGRWDMPQKIHLTTVTWTPENGLVTAALKLKRKSIHNYYEDQIKALYKKPEIL